MFLATEYPFMDILGTMALFFLWMIWFWSLIVVLSDVFGRHDLSGWGKAGWTVFMIILPVIGLLAYLIANGSDMAERRAGEVRTQQQRLDDHIRNVASADGPATEIAQAKELLDRGAIDEAEFAKLKHRALA